MPRTIDARFEIDQPFARGGMGTVYRAHDRRAGVTVALKLMQGLDADAAGRFAREAELLASFDHPAIVRYVASGLTAEGEPYLAMEWLEGEDLASRLARSALALEDALALVRGVAEALAMAHARRVIHRDVKPSNVFLVEGDPRRPKLLDFGIARIAGAAGGTRTGAGIGTPAYMAPEQARGLRDVDARVDVFALGCVAYECLAGGPAFPGEHAVAVLAKILLEEPEALTTRAPQVPHGIASWVQRLLSKDRAERPPDAAAALRALEACGDETARTQIALSTRTHETAFVTVRAVGASPAAPLAATIRADDPRHDVGALAERMGARLERLADGTLLFVLVDAAIASEQLRRAARAARERRHGAPAARPGIAPGRAVLARGLPVGEVLDRTARLLAHAAPGEVRLDPLSAGLLDRAFAIEGDATGLRLDGEARTHAARRLLGRRSTYVGRERDLELLVGLAREAVDEREPRGIVVTGEAGAGKSRLLSELVARLTEGEGVESPWILIASGDPLEAGVPYQMVARMIRAAAGIGERESGEVAWQKLCARLGRRLPRGADDPLLELLGAVAGVRPPRPSAPFLAAEQDPLVWSERTHFALEVWLRAECEAQPVAILFDDAQWSDGVSLGLLAAAFRRLGESRLFVAVIGRPELTSGRLAKLLPERASELKLARLGARPSERLVRSALGDDVPDEVVKRIVAHADGNAFFLEELIRAAAEGAHGSFPETVLAMASARIANLDEPSRRVLRFASVLGDRAPRDALRDTLGAELDVEAAIGRLVDHEVLELEPGTGTDAATLRFRHALLREAAYASHTDESRSTAHLAAAEWLARTGAAPLVLGEHLERGGDAARAALCFEQAANAAFRQNDTGSMVRLADRAIALGLPSERVHLLRSMQCGSLNWNNEFDRAEEHGDAVMREVEAGSPAWYRAITFVSTTKIHLGRGWEPVLQQFRAVQPAPSHLRRWALAACALAIDTLHVDRFEDSRELADGLVAVAERSGDPTLATISEQLRGWRAVFHDDPAGAWQLGSSSARAFEAQGQVRNAVFSRAVAIIGAESLGLWDAVEDAMGDRASPTNPANILFLRGSVVLALARRAAERGDHDEARDLVMSGLRSYPDQSLATAGASVALGWLAIDAGRLDEASAIFDRRRELIARFPPHERAATIGRAAVALRRGRADEALALALSVGDLPERRMYSRAEQVPLVIAEALAALGRRDEAREQAALAVARLERIAARLPAAMGELVRTKTVTAHRTRSLARSLGA